MTTRHQEVPTEFSLSGIQVGIVAAFTSFSVVFLMPLEILSSNLNELSLTDVDFVKIFVPAWVVCFLTVAVLISVLPNRTRTFAGAAFLAMGFAFWLQSSFMVWDYGPLDGSDIDWSGYWKYALIDSPVWVIVFGIAVAMRDRIVAVGVPAAAILMGIQTVAIAAQALSDETTQSDGQKRNFSLEYTNKYRFSKDQNVILFVLDAFQGDVFEEIVNEDPDYADAFDGFTYFRDAVAGGNYTELAIPALLTGKTYDNAIPREDFLRQAYLEHGISTRLKAEGYSVELYPWVGWGNESIYFDEAIASNLELIGEGNQAEPTFTEKKAKEALHLLDLSLFRSLPHVFKKFIHNDHKWFVTYIVSYLVPDEVKQVVATDNQFEFGTFINQAPVELPVDRVGGVFKYYHLKGAHAPLTVDENLHFTHDVFPFSKAAYIRQAKANLNALAEFFERLKVAGIYDRSLILVLGDHGSGGVPELYIEPKGASREPMRLDGSLRNFRRDKARAIPLVLIKRIEERGELKTSLAPVELTDIPATTLGALEMKASSDQVSMYDLDEGTRRRRYHRAFEFTPNKGVYVDDITLYSIEGNSWLNESWKVEGILKPNREN